MEGQLEARREAAVRRAVRRLGYRLVKSRHARTRGTFGIIDLATNTWVNDDHANTDGYGLTLAYLEVWVHDVHALEDTSLTDPAIDGSDTSVRESSSDSPIGTPHRPRQSTAHDRLDVERRTGHAHRDRDPAEVKPPDDPGRERCRQTGAMARHDERGDTRPQVPSGNRPGRSRPVDIELAHGGVPGQ